MIKLLLCDIDGTLTDGGYYVSSVKGIPNEYVRKFNTKDFVGLDALSDAGIKVATLTGSQAPCKGQFDRAAPFMTVYDSVQDKYAFVANAFIKTEGYSWDDIAFIGDELNDAKLLENVGWAACPADAAPEIIDIVENHDNGSVLERNGGDRCVREFTDIIRAVMEIPARWENWEEKECTR